MSDKIAALDARIRLFGLVNDKMFESFAQQLDKVRAELRDGQPVWMELTTTGGDAETGRRIAEDIRLCREVEGRSMRFIGKAAVYSAGISIMAAFPAADRYLTKGTELLIHERRVTKTVELSGALRSNMSMLRDELAALESGHRLECAGFAQLVEGTSMTVQQVLDKVMEADWYLIAEDAVKAGLVKAVI